MLANKIQLT